MKKIYLLLSTAVLLAACQQKPAEVATVETPPKYPYSTKHPDNWMIDTSHTNTMVALNALKSYETMDTLLMKKCFADSLTFNYEGGVYKGTIGGLIQMTGQMSGEEKNVKLDVKDWEAVIGKEGDKEEWVTVWYTQHWTDRKGKTDSIEYVNDFLIKNAKIVRLDEYARHFAPVAK